MTVQAPLAQHTIVAFLADIFERRGDEEYLGEPVTMSEHMLQGAFFAEQENESDEIVVATLLHDIGHFTSEFGMFSMDDTQDRWHEDAGAQVLERFFPKLVVDCVRYHVAAKRYLCAKSPEYFNSLSSASVHSLQLQGGPMSDEDMLLFEQNANIEAIVKVRRYDDRGKIAGLKTHQFAHYEQTIQRIVNNHYTPNS